MHRLLGWHTGVGEVGMRLFQLHLLWVVGTLAGGIVLGVFLATAAVYAVLRRDVMRDGRDGREALVREFRTAWVREFRTANVLGYTLAALWVLLLWDGQLLGAGVFAAAAPAVAGLVTIATVVLALTTTHAFALAAHFDEGPGALLRRSAVMVVARPVPTLVNAVVWAVVLCAYYVVPGLVPVFGMAGPAYLSFTYLWGTGLLPPQQPAQAGVLAPL
jgi:uncharacterized membrane protein YesL